MDVKLIKWGNSYGIRVPKRVIRELALKEKDTLELKIEEGKIILIPKRRYTLEDLVSKITPANVHGETNWGKAVGNEEW